MQFFITCPSVSKVTRARAFAWTLTTVLGTAALAACVVPDGSMPVEPPPEPPPPAPGPDAGQVPAPGDPAPPPSLKTVKVPEPENLGDFVSDRTAAIALGKALFWDMQVGSDGIQACASCHFHAGSDTRSKNQLSPGVSRPEIGGPANRDKTFQVGGAPNYQLTRADYPFHRKSDPENRDSPATFDANDITSSQGTANSIFLEAQAGRAEDLTQSVPDPDGFRVAGVNVRRVEARHTPSVINAVFNFRNFWDGRAQNEFNGVNSLGTQDPNAFLFKADPSGALSATKVLLRNASLASQAMEPPLSRNEMSGDGRTFPEIGDKLGPGAIRSLRQDVRHCGGGRGGPKLLSLRPLGRQLVDCDDSVLGGLSRAPQRGLAPDTYAEMIAAAFRPEWWRSSKVVEVDVAGTATVRDRPTKAAGSEAFTLMEYNFSLFFGLAVQMYEATLVSDDTPFDRFRDGDANAMTAQQKRGLDLFLSQTRGRCINCHGGAELTDASVTRHSRNQLRRREVTDILDFGFNNIGVRPTFEDLGIGGVHPLAPTVILSEARLAFLGRFNDPTLTPPIGPGDVLAVDGALKVPGLRNIELTAPYFHNGGYLTLRQVVDFYSRGGDFHPIQTQTGGVIQPLAVLNNTEEEREAFVAFLRSLTDERVRYRRAPFDHPQIFVPNGHRGDMTHVRDDGSGTAVDDFLEIRAVGRAGGAPLPTFLEP